MILPDLNLLLYAYNPHAPQHNRARRWWQELLDGDEMIALPHEICLGFVRISTHRRLGEAAVRLEAARAVVDGWLAVPKVRVMGVMTEAAASALVSDAVLTAFAIEHRAVLHSNDPAQPSGVGSKCNRGASVPLAVQNFSPKALDTIGIEPAA